MGGISVWQLLIVAAIVLLLFGSKRLRTLGGDLGTSIRGFKDSMKDDADDAQKKVAAKEESVIEGEKVESENKENV
jgi:sec-independent protein translocase protein TatA